MTGAATALESRDRIAKVVSTKSKGRGGGRRGRGLQSPGPAQWIAGPPEQDAIRPFRRIKREIQKKIRSNREGGPGTQYLEKKKPNPGNPAGRKRTRPHRLHRKEQRNDTADELRRTKRKTIAILEQILARACTINPVPRELFESSSLRQWG